MLTHALASEEEAVPYMQGHATKALVVAGRSAALEPAVPPRECVYYGWQDVLLPLVLSGLVPDDTLFLVCEGDFRFSPEDAQNPHLDDTAEETQGQALVKRVQLSLQARELARDAARKGEGCFSAGWKTPLCDPGCDGKCIGVCSHLGLVSRQQQRAEHFAAPADTTRGGAGPGNRRPRGGGPELQTPARSADTSLPEQQGAEHLAAPAARSGTGRFGWSQEVEDLVAYCNHALNGKAGDIVWLSWCPDGRADENKKFEQWMLTPCHGATLVGVTVRGAIAMAQAMQQSTPMHFDIWLKGQLMNKTGKLSPNSNQFFGASYLWPPTGSYATHKSANAAPPAKGSAKKNRNSGSTMSGDRLEDWGYPNQPCTRIPAAMDEQQLDGAAEMRQKWHSFQLVHIHRAQEGDKRIVSPDYASGKIHLETDMHRCLWWTFAAAAVNDLDKWFVTRVDVRGDEMEDMNWTSAVVALSQGAEHLAAPASDRGVQGAEHLAAPASDSDGWLERVKKRRGIVRMQHQWCLHRLDHGFCEACLLNIAHVVKRSRFMQIMSCPHGYCMLCRSAPSSTTSTRLDASCRMLISLMLGIRGPA